VIALAALVAGATRSLDASVRFHRRRRIIPTLFRPLQTCRAERIKMSLISLGGERVAAIRDVNEDMCVQPIYIMINLEDIYKVVY
jgi:hypothetical protein